MEFVSHLFVLAHLLGMAAIVGSAVFVARGVSTPALLWGARVQLITGVILVGLAEAGDEPGVVVAECDLAALERVRGQVPALEHRTL